jgi:hypothetical protein
MEGAEDLDVQVLKDSPAYGARNVQIVAAGTGEALPARQPAEVLLPEAWGSITDDLGKRVAGRVGVGCGSSTA